MLDIPLNELDIDTTSYHLEYRKWLGTLCKTQRLVSVTTVHLKKAEQE